MTKEKISFKIINQNWIYAFLGSALAMTLWIIASWPGSMGNDSQDVWSQVLTGDIRNDHPVANEIWFRLFSLNGNFLGGIVITQGLLMVLAVSNVVFKILATQRRSLNLIGGFFSTLLPQIGGLSVSLIKDAPYTIFLLLAISFFLNSVNVKMSKWTIFSVAICLLISNLFRHEAFFVTFLGLLLAILLFRSSVNKISNQLLGTLFATLILTVCIQNVLPYVLHAKEVSPWLRNSSFLIDVAYIENKYPGLFNKVDSDKIRAAVPASAVETTSDCKNPDSFFFSKNVDLSLYDKLSSDVKSLWLKAILKHPISLLEFRFCRSYVFFPPILGLDKAGWWQEWGIEENNNGVSLNAAPFEQLTDFFTRIVVFAEQNKWILAYPGVFAYLPLLYSIKKRRTMQKLGFILGSCISASTALFAFAWGSAPYYRYTSFALAFSTLMIVLGTLKFADRKIKSPIF